MRELAEAEGFRRIGSERGEMWNRLGLGAELHASVLEQRRRADSNYQSEIHLEAQISVGDWKANITGRLDGCIQRADGCWLIEEFKSAYAPETHVRPFSQSSERHRQQLLIYCHLWRLLGNSPVEGALIYVDIATGKEFPISVSYNQSAQQKEIEIRLQRLFAIWKSEEIIRKQKAVVALTLPFPHEAPREGQVKLIEAVQNAVRSGENLLAEAPTGSGKTAAGIHPALVEALSTGRQLFFLTAKTLQQKMASDALIAMNREGAFRTLQLRAKEKMCANDRVICHEDFCPYAKNYPEKMQKSGLLERLRETQTHHDPNAVFEEAKREKVCPFEVQLELASRADAVVADYNYVFNPGVSLHQLEDLENKILVVDEAHNLADRARQIFSPELHEDLFRTALENLPAFENTPALTPALFQRFFGKLERGSTAARGTNSPSPEGEGWGEGGRLKQDVLFLEEPSHPTGYLFGELRDTIESVAVLLQNTADVLPEDASIVETEPPAKHLRKIWKDWEPRFIRYLSWKRESKIATPEDLVIDCHFALQKFLSTLKLLGPGFSCVVEKKSGAGIRLALICLDPARPLAPLFKAAHSTIFLSATLTPFETTRRVLGLDRARTKTISLPPPFPRENRKVLILPQVQTNFAAREKNYPRIAKLVAEMAEAVPGNVLVLFPSYAFLEKVAGQMPTVSKKVLRQRPNVPDIERQEILRALSATTTQKILLFAVLGGMYAEGVDYPGELLSGVFVVSPALPQVSFQRELLRRYFDETEQAGFNFAYLQPGMTRVIQAAGRLIRSETDRGVIALICQRFLQMPYADFLPKDWFDETPAELITQDPVEQIQKFFDRESATRNFQNETNSALS
ncbi:MAG: ATP-dependent DNA helicase [Verrucomicrobiota bacterium]